MTDIKMPEFPKPDGTAEANCIPVRGSDGLVYREYEEVPAWSRPLVEKLMLEAVRLNAQADIRTLIADDAYAMTFQSLGQYRSALLSALSAATAAPQPAQQDAKPIYQYQLATGGWIDQTRDSYEYNKANGVKGLRIVYEAAPQPAQQPLTDEQMWELWNKQGSDEMNQQEAITFARAIEQAHGIGVKNER